MRRFFVVAVTLLTLAAPPAALARVGELDRSFAGDGTLLLNGRGSPDARLESIAAEPGGGAVLVASRANVVRVTPGGRVRADEGSETDGNMWPTLAVPHDDGGVLVVGAVDLGHVAAFDLAADLLPLRPPQRVDVRGWIEHGAVAAVPRDDGGALVAAGLLDPASAPPGLSMRVVAFRRDGTPDPAFGAGGTGTYPLASYGLRATGDADGGATFLLPGPLFRDAKLLRVAPDGVFSTPVATALPAGSVVAIARQGDRLLVATLWHVTALLPDGTVDRTFNHGLRIAVPRNEYIASIAVDPAGRVLVGSSRSRPGAEALVRRYGRDGRLDRRFGTQGRVRFHFGRVIIDSDLGRRAVPQSPDALAIDPYGRVLVGASVGNGLSDIREDYGRNFLAVARLRTTEPDADLRSRRLRITRSGIVHIPLRCRDRGRRCAGRVSLVVHGRVARGGYSLAAGSSASVHVRAARRGSRATVRIRATGRPGDSVDRLVRLVRAP